MSAQVSTSVSFVKKEVLPKLWIALFVIVSLFVLLFGSKILDTSFKLWSISFDITLIEDDARVNGWHETHYKHYEEDIDKRNALYNADGFCGWFANASKIIQVPLVLLTIVWYALLIVVPFKYVDCKKKNEKLFRKAKALKKELDAQKQASFKSTGF